MSYIGIRVAAATLMIAAIAVVNVIDHIVDTFCLHDKIGE